VEQEIGTPPLTYFPYEAHPIRPYQHYWYWTTTSYINTGWTGVRYLGLHGASGRADDPNNFWNTVFLDGHVDIVKASDYTYVNVVERWAGGVGNPPYGSFRNPDGKAIIRHTDYK
jgi:hypothetical protein